jgi:glutathione S-transferase
MHPTMNQIRDAIANCTHGLSEVQMRKHPEGKWDTAAILEHLALTYSSTARVMQKCLAAGHPTAGSPTLQHRMRCLVVLKLNFIPRGREAPKHVVPSLAMSGQEARELIFSNLESMDKVFAECEQSFGGTIKLADHPVLGPISLSGWRKFHLLHTRHHVKQIDAVVRAHPARASSAQSAT